MSRLLTHPPTLRVRMTAPIIVCMKWVALRPEVDPLTGVVVSDQRWEGPSLADQAALEVGLMLADAWSTTCEVVCVGASAADAMLRDALAAGARRVTRIDTGSTADVDLQPTSACVASLLGAAIATISSSPALVVCGDWSLDRGSASVPVFLSADLDIDAACGIVAVGDQGPGALRLERRLDGGRREVLAVSGSAVISVEGSVARLRRAPLSGVLAARNASIDVITPASIQWESAALRVGPFKPRARILEAPASADPRKRVEQLTGALIDRTPPRRLTLGADEAASVILDQLRIWGQIP